MNDNPYVPSKFVKHICDLETIPKDSSLVIKVGYVTKDAFIAKGMGSAEGGQWKPAKPDDERFLGEPDSINRSKSLGKRGGYDRETKIGYDGKASRERHHTDHDNPKAHSNPHDHEIDWSNGYPKSGSQINYPDGNAPEFKNFKEIKYMSKIIGQNNSEDNRFKTISDFKWCVNNGGEVEFEYNKRVFGIFPFQKRTPESKQQILICEKFVDNQEETEKYYNTADDALEFMIGNVRLRDVVTEIIVWDRTI